MISTSGSRPPRAPAPLSVSLSFQPVWAYLDGVREFGRFFCEATFKQPGVAERAQVVLQEALENAVKYSSREDGGKLELEMSSDGTELQISTLSHADPKHLRDLREDIDLRRRFNPEAELIAALARAAHEPDAAVRLRLARMRYESQFELQISEEGEGNVRVRAIGKL